MRHQHIMARGLFLGIVLLTAAVTARENAWGAESVDAPNEALFSLSCTWQDTLGVGKAEKGGISVVSGENTTFECDVVNKSKERSVLLLLVGKQIDVRGATDAAAANIELGVGASQKTTLTFPGVYRSGEYQYVFSLFDTQTKLPVGKELVLNGEMEGGSRTQVGIDRVSFDKERYDWADPFTLTVNLSIPEGADVAERKSVVRVALNNLNGEECAVLVEDQEVSGALNTYQLRFPKVGTCTNAVRVSLQDKEGVMLDQKTIAVGLPDVKNSAKSAAVLGQGFFGTLPRILLGAFVVTGILVVALVGYFVIRKKSIRRF